MVVTCRLPSRQILTELEIELCFDLVNISIGIHILNLSFTRLSVEFFNIFDGESKYFLYKRHFSPLFSFTHPSSPKLNVSASLKCLKWYENITINIILAICT